MGGLATKLSGDDGGLVAATADRLQPPGADEPLDTVRAPVREATRRAAASAADGLAQLKDAIGALQSLAATVAAVLARMIRLVAAVPAGAARVLEAVGRTLGDAGERGREIAAVVEPPRSEQRRRRLAAAGIFLGGFATGAAVGWVLHDRLHQPPGQPPGDPDWAERRGEVHTGAAAAIDARGAR